MQPENPLFNNLHVKTDKMLDFFLDHKVQMEVSNNNSGRTQISDNNAGSGIAKLNFPGAPDSGNNHFENDSAEVQIEDESRKSNIMGGGAKPNLKRSNSFQDNQSSNSVTSQDYDDNLGRQKSVQFVKTNDLVWDSTIAQVEDDEFSVSDSIGSENKIKTTTTKTSIMTIAQKQRKISANNSKNNSFIAKDEEEKF